MAAATSGAPQQAQPTGSDARAVQRQEGEVKKRLNALGNFWTKLSNDWVFNFSGTLAYGFMTSIFPILLVIIGIGGLILDVISPSSRTLLEAHIADGLPGGAGGSGGLIVSAATRSLTHSAGAILIIGIVIALVTGSSLFITMENVFGVIFRLRGRSMIHQRVMSIGMLLLYTVLVPIIVLASIVPAAALNAAGLGANNPIGAFLLQVLGLLVSFIAAAVLFGSIYVVVPNRPVHLPEVWVGTLVAAALLVVYQIVFPIYESLFIHPGNYGSIVGFAVVIIAFFYYLAFILLLGAEINSWIVGQRQTAGSIDAILHELQAHNTTRGAAGPTAGDPREDLQSAEGAAAMRDSTAAIRHERTQHKGDALPPKFAESGATGAGYSIEAPQTAEGLANITVADRERRRTPHQPRIAHSQRQAIDEAVVEEAATSPGAQRRVDEDRGLHRQHAAIEETPPLSPRQRNALLAVLGAGAVALVGAGRFAYDLAFGRNNPRHPATG